MGSVTTMGSTLSRRQRSSGIQAHMETEGVEYAHDPRIYGMVAMIRHGHGFRKAFGFVVDAAIAGGIHFSPAGFRLRLPFYIVHK